MDDNLTKRKPCDNECPFRVVMNRFGDKWSILIIQILAENDILRFGELLNRIDGISLKVLTSSLKTLEKDGFITRQVYSEVPPRVEYRLTQIGQDVIPYIDQMIVWAEKNVKTKSD